MIERRGAERTILISAALGQIDAIWDELSGQKRNYLRAGTVQKGLLGSTRFLRDLGVFFDYPVWTDIDVKNGVTQLLPINLGERQTIHRTSDEQYFLTPIGYLVKLKWEGEKLLWDEKRWVMSDDELCEIVASTLGAIRKSLSRAERTQARALRETV